MYVVGRFVHIFVLQVFLYSCLRLQKIINHLLLAKILFWMETIYF